MYGESDGKQGIFPTSFITIVKDCDPQVKIPETQKAELQEPESQKPETHKPETQKQETSIQRPSINWTTHPGRSNISLDSVIAQNLNQLEKSNQSNLKQPRFNSNSFSCYYYCCYCYFLLSF